MSIYTTPVLNINLKKLIDNYKQLMTMSTPAIPAAVVKDDAYGIGAKIVAQTLYKKTHCRHFFVAHAKEGADIRPYVPDATIYVLQGIGADTLSLFDRHNLVPVISSPEMLKFWQQYKLPNIKPAIQIETGLNRLGFRKEELETLFTTPSNNSTQEITEATILNPNSSLQLQDEEIKFEEQNIDDISYDDNNNTSPSVILEAMRQHQHIGDPQTSAPAHNHDGNLAHPLIKESDFCLVISHLSCADEQSHFMNYRQLENFIELKNKYFPNTMSSLSASDGVFLSTEFHFDMVRLGAAMYGINTAPYRENEMQNIIELKAPVLQVAKTQKGDFIGYSATYKCAKEMKIAIVSIGYGDGVPRSLSNKGKVLFYEHGTPHLCPILGRVSMDNIICDVSSLQSIKTGDFGTIINNDYTVDDVAKDAETIAYELISRLGKNPRILKNYIDE